MAEQYLVHLADETALNKFRSLVGYHAHKFHYVTLPDESFIAIVEPTDNGYNHLDNSPGATVFPHRTDPDPIEPKHFAAISKAIPHVKETHTSAQVHKLIFKATGEHHLFR